jgi:hypothetical protein
MFSTWNIHYWNTGLQLSIAVPDFFKWTYKLDDIRSEFKIVHYIYSIKFWLAPFSISLKEHSVFRAFKLVYDITAKNISLQYKKNSLLFEWMKINGMKNVGILFFHFFPGIIITLSFVASKELKAKIISDLLSSSAIVKDLDSANKEFSLQLYTDTKFYLVDQSKQNFLNLEPFHNVLEEMPVYGPHIKVAVFNFFGLS